jgi:hypothetical protein
MDWHETMRTNSVPMIMVEIKISPEESLGPRFHDETWRGLFDHFLDHDPSSLPWCTIDKGV